MTLGDGTPKGQQSAANSIPVVLASGNTGPYANIRLPNVEKTDSVLSGEFVLAIAAYCTGGGGPWSALGLDANLNLLVTANSPYLSYNHTFTGTATDSIHNLPASIGGLKYWSLQIVQTGGVATWTVILEGSLDGTNFSTIATHTQVTTSGVIVSAGPLLVPQVRLRCSAFAGGTNVAAYVLGTQ